MTTADGLQLTDVAAAPGGTPVLHDVTMRVPTGTCTAVLGASGAGKTTLLRVVAGLEPATAGSVHVAGRDLTDVPTHRRRVGVVFQEPRLLPHRTVRDNVAFGLEVAGVDRTERHRRADELLARVGLADTGDRTVEGLSGGEQQRINLARALAVEPDVLLLDEPLSSVDPERRDDLRTVIAEAAAGLTRLHVTHDRAEAAEVGDRIAVLADGTVAQHAAARALFEAPATTAVATLLGATVLRGHVRDGRLELPAGRIGLQGPDGPATIAVRPEDVTLGAGPLQATVVRTAYRGAVLRVVLALDDDTVLPADVPPATTVTAGSTIAFDLARIHRLDDGART